MKKKSMILAAMMMAASITVVGCGSKGNDVDSTASPTTTSSVSEDITVAPSADTNAEASLVSTDANDVTPDTEEPTGMLDEGGNFLGIWGCGRATMNVSDGDVGGRYVVTITWGSSAFETTVWTYQCKYSQEVGGLVSDSGEMRTEVYSDDSSDPEIRVDENQEAIFTLDSEGIKWDDKVNNRGADMVFTK